MREDVLRSDLLIDPELFERSAHLVRHSGQDHRHSPLAGTLTEVAKVVDTRNIDERHLAHTYDTHLCTRGLHLFQFLETACKTEEERSVDFIDLDSFRNIQSVGIFHRCRLIVLCCRNSMSVKN